MKKPVWAVLLALSVAAAGCGDDDDDVTVDGAVTRDGGTTVDGSTLTPDASTVTAPGSAVVVLGQPDFTSGQANGGGVMGMATLNRPNGIAAAAGRLWVADQLNMRALQWNAMPTANLAPANVQVGRAELGETGRLFSDGVRLLVSDPNNQRVLVWNPIPTTDTAAPSIVLGSGGDVPSATHITDPQGIWTDGTKLAIVDGGSSRVLLWNTFPTDANDPADIVLGQPTFDEVTTQPMVPTASTLRGPKDVMFYGNKLFVVDSDASRILVWNGWPTQNNAAAAFAIGADLVTDGGGTDNAHFNEPMAIAIAANKLYVSDAGNRRVLMFDPVPAGPNAGAVKVFGQDDMETIDLAPLPTSNRFILPRGLAVLNNRLFVADHSWNRVLVFALD